MGLQRSAEAARIITPIRTKLQECLSPALWIWSALISGCTAQRGWQGRSNLGANSEYIYREKDRLGLQLSSRPSQTSSGVNHVTTTCSSVSPVWQHLVVPSSALPSSSSLPRTTSQCPTSRIPAAIPPPPPPPHHPHQPRRCHPAPRRRPRCTHPRSAHASRSSSTCQVPDVSTLCRYRTELGTMRA